MTTDRDREAFDAWARDLGMSTGTDDQGRYANPTLNHGLAAYRRGRSDEAHAREAWAQEPVAVPAGWKLMPVEPTREMWAAMADTLYRYKNRHHDKAASDLWGAALSAAPVSPPAESGEVGRLREALRVIAEPLGDGVRIGDPWSFYADLQAVAREALASTPAQHPADPRRVQDALTAEAKAQSPQPGGAVKVKALEWVDRSRYSAAASAVGEYEAYDNAWWFRNEYEGTAPSRAAAKAAAQADYERRILSALEPSPSGWDAGAFEAGAKAMREEIAKAFKARAPELSGPDYGLASEDVRHAVREAAECAHECAEFVRSLPIPTPPAGEG